MAEDASSSLERRIDRLASQVTDVERRLSRLEAGATGARAPAAEAPATPTPAAGAAPAALLLPDIGPEVALVGRTLFVLAGAFLLRAQTDSGRLDASVGVMAGLAFAATWIVMTDRAGSRGLRASAVFHGGAFVLIAFPLIFEAVTRFHFFDAGVATASLGVCTALALAVSWRRRLHGLAWVAALAGLVTAIALAVATGTLGPAAFYLTMLGVAALWFGYALDWRLLRWPIAIAADLVVLILSVRAAVPGSADSPAAAFGAEILLLGAYLGSFATRTLVLNRDVIPFEVAQSIVASAVGLGGAAYLTSATGGGLLPGAAALALAAGCYGAAAIFIERRHLRRRNYVFYTSAGLVFALAGTALAYAPPRLGVVYAAFGLAAASAGRLFSRVTYRAHGAVYLAAATLASGLFPHAVYGIGLPAAPGGRVSPAMLAVLVACVAALWGLGFGARTPAPARLVRIPRTVVLLLVLGGIAGTAMAWVLPDAPATGAVAVVHTALVVSAILALAVADRFWNVVEGGWLVYPLLVVTGLKFLLEDLRTGTPGTLFVSFALYGLALILGPRLRRQNSRAAAAARSDPLMRPASSHERAPQEEPRRPGRDEEHAGGRAHR
jgi:hypothetical protein